MKKRFALKLIATCLIAAGVTAGFSQDVIKIASIVEQAVLDGVPQLGVATRAIAVAAKN